MLLLQRFLFLGSAVAFVGCGAILPKKKSNQGAAPQVETSVFVHGEPSVLIKGASGDTAAPFVAAESGKWGDFELAGWTSFRRESQALQDGPRTRADLEKANAAPDGSEGGEDLGRFAFQRDAAGDWLYAGRAGPRLVFSEIAGHLQLKSYQGAPAEVVHYSVNHAANAFSLLLKVGTGAEERLTVLYFVHSAPATAALPPVDPKYHYLLGAGVRAVWDGALKVTICGAHSAEDVALLERATKAWTTGGKIGTREFTIVAKADARPFTDLNENCVRIIDDYLFENSPFYATSGLTLTVIDQNAQKILASDVFISRSGSKKVHGAGWTNENLVQVIQHELGHFLGLHHEFVKNADGTNKYPSIMGYGKNLTITQHDREAIEQLYGTYTVE